MILVGCGISSRISKLHVVGPLARPVLVDEILDRLATPIEFVQTVAEHGFLAVVVQKRVAASDAVVLLEHAIEQFGHARVVGQQKARDGGRLLLTVVRIGAARHHLDRGGSPRYETEQLAFANSLEGAVDGDRIDVDAALDNVEGRNVAALRRVGRDHDVSRLREAAHDIQDTGFADGFAANGCCCITTTTSRRSAGGGGKFELQRRVSRHEKVTAGRGNETGQQTNEIVVHVSGIAQGGGGSRHDGGNQIIEVIDGGIVQAEPFRGDAIERGIVEHNDSVRRFGETFHCQNRIVRLHHNIGLIGLSRKDRVSLNEFLGKVVVQFLEQIASHSRSSATRNGMRQDKSLERIGIVRFAINHIEDSLVVFGSLSKAGGPIVASAASVLRHKNVFGVEKPRLRIVSVASGEFVHDARFQINQ